ncbi:MAG: hypothetical protein Q8R91_05050 [Candidatus Omnitrophota bacterium]|nr:hypothetical protein [Candidatus Omnitrophota bacterium]
MPKRSSKKSPVDPNQAAAWIVAATTGQPTPPLTGKNPAAVALGRLGGLKGGKARASKLTSKQRQRIALKAARFRWKYHR